MQQPMSLMLILMETEMLNGFRQFNFGIQSSTDDILDPMVKFFDCEM